MNARVEASSAEIAPYTSRSIETFRGLSSPPRDSTRPERVEPGAADRVEISAAGRQQSEPAPTTQTDTAAEPGTSATLKPSEELDTSARRALEALQQRDQEVRLHEQAHLLAAGQFATGGPQYTYETGPDGRRYAVGGEVPIDLSAIAGDPEATIQKARTLRRAALAPADPSGPDLAVAAQATALAAQAQQELTKLQSTPDSGSAEGAGALPQDDERSASATPAGHVCGPNCQEHQIRAGSELPPSVSGGLSFAGVLASRAVESYRLASRRL